MVKLAKASKPFSACSLFVSEQALPTALELLAADGSERGGEVTKEAVERLQQAAGCLRQAGEALSGLAHLCRGPARRVALVFELSRALRSQPPS